MQERVRQVEEAIATRITSEAQIKVLVDAKQAVEKVIAGIKDLEKIKGATKQSKNAIKVMQKFLKCNVTNPAIYKKYQEVMVLMERYAHGGQA